MTSQHADIQTAIDSLDVDRARLLLRDALKEPDAETYFLAAQVALYDEQKLDFLKKALELDPFHKKSFEALKQLEAPNTPSPSPVAVAAPKPAGIAVQPERARRQQIEDLERKISRLESEIAYHDQGFAKCKRTKILSLIVGFIGVFSIVIFVGILLLIVSAFSYNKATNEEKKLQDEKFDLQNDLNDARQELNRLQREA